MILTKEDIPFGVGKDNMAYRDAYLTGAKAQLKKVVEMLEAHTDSRTWTEVNCIFQLTVEEWQTLLEETK